MQKNDSRALHYTNMYTYMYTYTYTYIIHICIIYICIIYVYICICIHIQTVTPKALELNVRPEIIKFLIENKGSKLTDIGLR